MIKKIKEFHKYLDIPIMYQYIVKLRACIIIHILKTLSNKVNLFKSFRIIRSFGHVIYQSINLSNAFLKNNEGV